MPQKVLVVDDNDDLRTMLESVLIADGYLIDLAEGMDTALKLMASCDYDVMLIDKNIPGINGNPEGGIDLLRHVRSLSLSAEVIMMTGHPTVETAMEAMKLGAFDYIHKPFSLKDLRLKMRRLSQYRNFLNPDYTIGFYRRLQAKMLELIERLSKMSDNELEQALLSLNDEIDKVFANLKENERIILAEREALSRIADLAERLKMNMQKTDDNYELVDKISRLSNERI